MVDPTEKQRAQIAQTIAATMVRALDDYGPDETGSVHAHQVWDMKIGGGRKLGWLTGTYHAGMITVSRRTGGDRGEPEREIVYLAAPVDAIRKMLG